MAGKLLSVNAFSLDVYEERPAYSGCGGNDLPRQILIFFASTETGFACRTGLLLLRFLISAPDLGIAAGFRSETTSSVQ